jgi:hypothetical protein
MIKQIEKLRFISFPGSYPNIDYYRLYASAYECWSSVWREAYADLAVDKKVFADDFTRQMQINTLFYEDQCLGSLFLNLIDTESPVWRQDSYFKLWPDSDVQKIYARGRYSLVLSSLVVHPDWRGLALPIKVKDLLFYYVCRSFANSSADSMIAITRVEKKVNEQCYRFGATPVSRNIPHFNEKDLVDIVAFSRSTVIESPDPAITRLGRELWQSQIEVGREVWSISSPQDKLKKSA